MQRIDRRHLIIAGGAAFVSAVLPVAVLGQTESKPPEIKKVKDLKPGQFTWNPDRSPKGPVAIIVSIPDQRVYVYRNGIRIGVSTCSTGKPGHSTPTGVFTILEKDKNHHSSTYNNAPMPNMNRLTWSGVALHAGNLPGYPASHGCIRLPLKFSEKLFSITHVGTPVIVAGSHSDPKEVVHPGLVLADAAEAKVEQAAAKGEGKTKRERLPWEPVIREVGSTATAVIVSHADSSITVLENGKIVAEGKAVIANPEAPLGRHVFILQGADKAGTGLAWHAITHHDTNGKGLPEPETAVLMRISADKTVLEAMRARAHIGMLFITTELPAHPETRSDDDFVLMNTDGA